MALCVFPHAGKYPVVREGHIPVWGVAALIFHMTHGKIASTQNHKIVMLMLCLYLSSALPLFTLMHRFKKEIQTCFTDYLRIAYVSLSLHHSQIAYHIGKMPGTSEFSSCGC